MRVVGQEEIASWRLEVKHELNPYLSADSKSVCLMIDIFDID